MKTPIQAYHDRMEWRRQLPEDQKRSYNHLSFRVQMAVLVVFVTALAGVVLFRVASIFLVAIAAVVAGRIRLELAARTRGYR